MKKVYRFENNIEYWDRRWAESGTDANTFSNTDIYPIKFADMVMQKKSAKALEIGAGAGRIFFHYKNLGYCISGIERSHIAVENILKRAPKAEVYAGDAMNLPFENKSFDVVMAFGVYHNLEDGIDTALSEVSRCLKLGGKFCISMRPNNIEMWLNELYWRMKAKPHKNQKPEFHKLLVSDVEFSSMLEKAGLKVEHVTFARNVSIFYRIPFLRHNKHLSESHRRSEGYKLNVVGRVLHSLWYKTFPYHSANVMVFIGTNQK